MMAFLTRVVHTSKISAAMFSFMALSLVTVSACNQQKVDQQNLPVETVYASNDCAVETAVLRQLDRAELESMLNASPRQFGEEPVSFAGVDEDSKMLILYAMGRQSSAGYAIVLTSDSAAIRDGSNLVLPVMIDRRAEGAVTAQVITRPCSVYALPRVEFTQIVIDSE